MTSALTACFDQITQDKNRGTEREWRRPTRRNPFSENYVETPEEGSESGF